MKKRHGSPGYCFSTTCLTPGQIQPQPRQLDHASSLHQYPYPTFRCKASTCVYHAPAFRFVGLPKESCLLHFPSVEQLPGLAEICQRRVAQVQVRRMVKSLTRTSWWQGAQLALINCRLWGSQRLIGRTRQW